MRTFDSNVLNIKSIYILYLMLPDDCANVYHGAQS